MVRYFLQDSPDRDSSGTRLHKRHIGVQLPQHLEILPVQRDGPRLSMAWDRPSAQRDRHLMAVQPLAVCDGAGRLHQRVIMIDDAPRLDLDTGPRCVGDVASLNVRFTSGANGSCFGPQLP